MTTHETALIELPYRDYATCYDHLLRSQTDPNWLSRVSDLVTHQALSKFEKSALDQFSSGRNPCPWLGNQQIDVFEKWSLGLGLLVERGRDRPAALPKAEQRHLIDVGYGITRKGQNRLYSEIDTALTRHRTRLSGTWLHQWALQSCAPPERQKFRNLMKQICENQGRFHLLNVSLATADEHLVRCEIASLSDQTNRSKTWVRRALQREMLLPAIGVPQTRCLKEHMRRCRRYILAVVESLDSTKSAERLNIGIAGFESLVTDGVISRMKNRSHKKRRFVPSKLDDLLDRIDQNTTTRKTVSIADYCSIPEACFQYGPTTGQVTRLLIGNQLPSSVQLAEKRGFDGVRIRRDELLAAMKIFADDHISPRQLSRHLGLSFAELRTLRELQLLPSFPPPKGDRHRSIKCISQIVLRRFLERYQTVTTAARYMNTDEGAVQAKIKLAAIKPAREGNGLPIFHRADLLG